MPQPPLRLWDRIDGGGWTLVDNDASTTSFITVRRSGATTSLEATAGMYLPGYAWSPTPQLLCAASRYTAGATANWVTFNVLTANARSYPTQAPNGKDPPVPYKSDWSVAKTNGNMNYGALSYIWSSGSPSFGTRTVYLGGTGAGQITCACSYHDSGVYYTGVGGNYSTAASETCNTWVR